MKAVVIGANGAIGGALVNALVSSPQVSDVVACSRAAVTEKSHLRYVPIDILDELSIAKAAEATGSADIILLATGILHDGDIMPEKSLRDLDAEHMARLFALNSTAPALVMKHFIPLLPRTSRGIFAALSARVGSISDNRLGGWYAYRASKAALNMLIKTASIEVARRYKEAIIVGLHPGTVDSGLSKPFQANVPEGKLFTPDHAAECLLNVLSGLTPDDTGYCYAWDGQRIDT